MHPRHLPLISVQYQCIMMTDQRKQYRHGNQNMGIKTWESKHGNQNMGIKTWESKHAHPLYIKHNHLLLGGSAVSMHRVILGLELPNQDDMFSLYS